MRNNALLGAMGAMLLCMPACTPFKARAPRGFAALAGKSPFRALTPEGVIYRVRQADNEPKAGLAFWRQATKRRMQEAGYVYVGEQSVKAAGVPGYLLELAAPFGEKDFSYLVAVFVRDDDLTLVEVTGEVAHVRARRDAVLRAIESLSW